MRAKTFSIVAAALYAGTKMKSLSTIRLLGEAGAGGHVVPRVFVDVEAHGSFQSLANSPLRLPAEQGPRLGDVGNATVGILVALAVEDLARHVDDLRQSDRRVAELLRVNLAHHLRHSADGDFVIRRPDVEDLPVAHAAPV